MMMMIYICWDGDSWGPNEHCFKWKSRSPYFATVNSYCTGTQVAFDAAFTNYFGLLSVLRTSSIVSFCTQHPSLQIDGIVSSPLQASMQTRVLNYVVRCQVLWHMASRSTSRHSSLTSVLL